MVQQWSQKRFWILIWIVATAGISQGMLIPILSVLLERQGVSISENGLSTSMLYLGMLSITPFCPTIIRKIGYRTGIVIGLGIVTCCVFLFPIFASFWIWMVLRFLVGVGDSLLHFTTQLWITSTAPDHLRGRKISQYGLAYGLGFGIGPLFMQLLPFGVAVPFIVLGIILLFTFLLLFQLEGGRATFLTQTDSKEKLRIGTVYRIGLVALCPAILYAFLESALAGNFPIIGLRSGLSESWISTLISTFVWGSLFFQVPLGLLGDRIGRKPLLIGICLLGGIGMFFIPSLLTNQVGLFVMFGLVGGLTGSLFSLGLTYLTDLLPKRYLALGNTIASMHFSIGSIIGPYLGAVLIQGLGGSGLFYFLAGSMIFFVFLALVYPVQKAILSEPLMEQQVG